MIPTKLSCNFRSRLGQRLALALLLLGTHPSAALAGSADSQPTVSIVGGVIQGRALAAAGGAVFKGIPFAQPPVGNLRWREPLPVLPWSGVRECVQSGPPAAQLSLEWNKAFAASSKEDCLYLDVWTPNCSRNAHKPVMVWVHGGANVAGAGGADLLYDGRSLISHDVVLVVVEYRLGIFGFFAHPDLTRESPHHASGNYAFLDQIAALQWVHDNIAAFGGDPANVTLFGQSAGAIDIMALMASPLSRGLFQRAIAESGPLVAPQARPLAEVELEGRRTGEALGAPAQGALAYLRSLPTETLLRSKDFKVAFAIDQWIYPENPAVAFARGGALAIPLLVGSNAVEFPFSGTPEAMMRSIRETFGDLSPKALALYGLAGSHQAPMTDPLYGDPATQWGSDLMRCPGIVLGESHAVAGNAVWEYQFDRAIPPRPRVGHSSDLPYVFGNLYAKGGQAGDFQDADRRLSATIQGYWTNFAKTGNPNGPGLPAWPRYEPTKRPYIEFTTTADIRVGENQRGSIGDLFRELMAGGAAPMKAAEVK